jgi:hypothetical protein
MRQITRESVKAFLNGENFNKSNMNVTVEPNVTILKYQGNAIAYKYNDPNKTISITNCGWESNTTKERLNGIIDLSGLNIGKIYQKNWQWYLNGKEWNGELIDLN